ncbi:MAG TPA: YkgJ family cysteine cluster protein [Capillibacterium sp.]
MFELNSKTAPVFKGLDQLWQVYQALDEEIANLKAKAGIDCLPYCKKCCATPAHHIEVSVWEILPLALALWQKGEAKQWLDKLDALEAGAPCVLFNKDPAKISGCSAYPWRPLLCRLFGFSACLNKRGKPLVVLCKELKEHEPGVENRVQKLVDAGLKIPVNSYYARQTANIHPYLGQDRYPINEALKRALAYIGLKLAYISEDDNSHDWSPPGSSLGKPA